MSEPDHRRKVHDSAKFGYFTAVVGVIILAAMLRFVGLERVPPGINQDEANRAYEAYCLAKTGKDHYGQSWPIFFRAFGNIDYPPGTYIYALIPVQALLGMTVLSTRLPAAFLGTLNVWLLYLLVKPLYGKRAALLAALFLAVSPWHIHLSRLAFEVSLCPPLITLGLFLIVRCQVKEDEPADRALPPRDLISLAGAGLALGLALWTYNALRIVVPLLLIAGGLLYAFGIRDLVRRGRGWYGVGLFLCGFLVALSPFLWASVKTPDQTWARAAVVNVFKQSSSLSEALTTMIRGYAVHFGPAFLFISGDEIQVQSVPGYGQLHYYCAFLLPFGLYRVVRRWRSEPFGLFLLWWILVAPLPAALTPLTTGHCLRSAGVLPAYQILAAMGLEILLCAANRRSAGLYRFAVGLAVTVVALNTAYFLYLFTMIYPTASARQFQVEWAEVIKEVRNLEPSYNAVVLTNKATNQLGMLYLFLGPN